MSEGKNMGNGFLERIVGVMRENQKFLLNDSAPKNRSIGVQVLGLISDANRYAGFFLVGEKVSEGYADSCIRPYIFLILRPFSHALLADMLASNVVACFMELRLMVESLVKFYYADMRYSKKASFREKIRMLEEYMRSGEKSMSDLMEECGWEKTTKKARFLWKQLSEGWLHTRGVVDRIVEEVTSKPGIPAWLRDYKAYTSADLDVLEELRTIIQVFRGVQNRVIANWKDLIQSSHQK